MKPTPPPLSPAAPDVPPTIVLNIPPRQGVADRTIIELSADDVVQLEEDSAIAGQCAALISLQTGQVVRYGPFDRTERNAPTITIGRAQRCTITIDHKEVSRVHAELSFKDGGFVLRDCRSAGGTFLDGQPIMQTELAGAQTFSLARAILIRTRVVLAPKR